MTSLPSPAEFLASAPKPVNGSSPWAARYAAELRRVLLAHAAQAPRTLQSHLGPSELGVHCDRQVAGKLAALPVTNHISDPWPSIVGTALHAWAADAFTADNIRGGLLRWISEQRVTPHPEHPGTADLYDGVEQAVVDHKFLGDSSLDKVRSKGPSRAYRVQLLLYGLGYMLMGLPVRRVALAAYPRTRSTLDGLYVWDTGFTDESGDLLPEVFTLLEEVFAQTEQRKAWAAAIVAGTARFLDVPASTDTDECYFCPFYRPSAVDGGPGCPGKAGAA